MFLFIIMWIKIKSSIKSSYVYADVIEIISIFVALSADIDKYGKIR